MTPEEPSRMSIGILAGAGSAAGIDLWQSVLREQCRRTGSAGASGWDAPDITVVSVPMPSSAWELESRAEAVWAHLRAAAERLAAQVDVYALACDTLQLFAARLKVLPLSSTLITLEDAVAAERQSITPADICLTGPVREIHPRVPGASECLARALLDWKPQAGFQAVVETPDSLGPSDSQGTLLIVYAGGTFGMEYRNGILVETPSVEHAVKSFMAARSATRGEHIAWRYVGVAAIIDSAEADQQYPLDIASTIRQYAVTVGATGVVLIHGTDTLAYTAARLAFTLADLSIPIVCTGAQVPLGMDGSDAQRNFDDAVTVALGSHVTGTWIAFGGRIISGVRATKTSSDSAQGFTGYRPLAEHPEGIPESVTSSQRDNRLRHHATVGVIKLVPGITPEEISACFRTPGWRCPRMLWRGRFSDVGRAVRAGGRDEGHDCDSDHPVRYRHGGPCPICGRGGTCRRGSDKRRRPDNRSSCRKIGDPARIGTAPATIRTLIARNLIGERHVARTLHT